MNPTHSRTSLEQDHTPEAIHQRLEQGPSHSYLSDFVYGAIDGTVTTFAVVSGVAGAGLSSTVIVVLGVANLLADGFSMAVSNFLGSRAEQQQREKARRTEEHHIAVYPAGEREEIRQILQRKGFAGEDLERAVEIITSDVQQWVEMMLKEELGVMPESPSPPRAAASTFVAFLCIGALPLLVFLVPFLSSVQVVHRYEISAGMTAVAFFVVGAVKSRFVEERWYWAGLETLLIGGTAAALAYGVGFLLGTAAGL